MQFSQPRVVLKDGSVAELQRVLSVYNNAFQHPLPPSTVRMLPPKRWWKSVRPFCRYAGFECL